MVVIQGRGKTQSSGKSYTSARKKRLYEKGRMPSMTKIGEKTLRSIREKGGNKKSFLLNINEVNLLNPKSKKFSKAKILNVVENAANRHFIRRNILTKGAVVLTDKGKAKITSRPGQEGTVNAVIVE